jgi:predicted nucleic acid-binding protein
MRQLIADAGPLIGLSRVGHLKLLADLYGEVAITAVVAEELGLPPSLAPQDFPGLAGLLDAVARGWIRVSPVSPDGWADLPLNPGVDAGEASSIALALQWRCEQRPVLLLMDDRIGRAEARRQALPVTGTAAVVALAQEQGLIAEAASVLDDLRSQGYFISPAIVAAVLAQLA